jgi:drug/metabolite transporter (DMT)-like permease
MSNKLPFSYSSWRLMISLVVFVIGMGDTEIECIPDLLNYPRRCDGMRRPALLIIFAAFLWGLIGIFGTLLNREGLRPFDIVGVRAVTAAISMFVYWWFKDRNVLKIDLKDLRLFIGTGIFSFVFFNFCFFTAMKHTSVAVSVTLLYTGPAFVALLSRLFFGERMTRSKWLALTMTLIGCALVTGLIGESLSQVSWIGLLAGLGSGFGYALYSIFSKIAVRKYTPATITTYTFIMASAGVLPFIRPEFWKIFLVTPGILAPGLALGLLCTVLPFLLYTRGIQSLEASKASLIATIEPVFAAVVGVILFEEVMTLGKLVGIALVIGAVVMINAKDLLRPKYE